MILYSTFSILIVLAAIFAYLNFRFLKLPPSIGLMLLALITSILIIGVGEIFPAVPALVTQLLTSFDFSQLLLGSMLSFMLFAGAIHVDLKELQQEKLSVILFSTLSVLLSTFIIGTSLYFITGLFNIQPGFIYCLLFGALISPTDPIAVLSILKEARIGKSLEMKIAGESLFNDGVAVVVFLTILEVAHNPSDIHWYDILRLFLQEAAGGIALGIAAGYAGFLLLKSIDNYKVEVLITIAIVMGGYSIADFLHVSGPLAVVVAGIILGNQGKKLAMSATTHESIDKFWELIDETLNSILFVLIGMELLTIHFHATYFILAAITIVVVLVTRYISVLIPAQVIKLKEIITHRTILILTWGGLRGGISVALALSLQPEMHRELWVTLTYFVVAFSILFQGLTIGKLAGRLKN
ncbi:MAG: sodium:proton antiporter [Chitinophagales bacterium]